MSAQTNLFSSAFAKQIHKKIRLHPFHPHNPCSIAPLPNCSLIDEMSPIVDMTHQEKRAVEITENDNPNESVFIPFR
ncbi:MAG: hypothetical protein ACOVQR_13605 [Flavobacterium sp.]|uniref:hypothetical protein n=1 Tax=Flavobacterium sp. TaxID=239 RepID=UPI003BA62B48